MLAVMLVQFKSDVGGFTMFGDIATQLLRMAGHSGTVPSAIPADGVAQALSRLRGALERLPPDPADGNNSEAEGDAGEAPVSLARRAYPLLDLLEKAVAEEGGIRWDEP